MIQSIENIQHIIESIDLSEIGSVTETMSTEFSVALQNAVDLKLKGPKFDSFESLVRSSRQRNSALGPFPVTFTILTQKI